MFLVRIVVGLLLVGFVLGPIEKLWPAVRGQKAFRPGWSTDVLHFGLNPVFVQVGVIVAVIPAYLFAQTQPWTWWQSVVGSQPDALQFVEAVLLAELAGYWAHRATHSIPALWRLHRVHHSSERMDWLAAGHLHPLDSAFVRACAVMPLLFLGFSAETFGVYLVLAQFHAIAQHANVRTDFGPFRWFVGSPAWHHWHHSSDPEARDTNFSGMLPFLDVVFGTAHFPKDRWPAGYGIETPLPAHWPGQMASPFRRDRAPASIATTTGASGSLPGRETVPTGAPPTC
jgi:sterol desaturase/sphingolipid hydroxylase (fatty acid hydroxylase superfamily)